jgi:RNA 2',3'-cyclic 3'-phosphodiesterase
VRVFVALDIPDAVRAAIAAFVVQVRPACPGARWVRVAGAHVTLKFVGEVVPEKISSIRSALSAVAAPPSIAMSFHSVGFFPNDRRPRVFWAGVESDAALSDLARGVDDSLAPLGFPKEGRAFTPHLTLARLDDSRGLEKLRAAIVAAGPHEFGHAVATEFHLYQSMLKSGGAEYTRLATFLFSGSTKQ